MANYSNWSSFSSTFVPVEYIPDDTVVWLASWPRFVGSSNISFTFNDAGEEYAKGLGSVVGPFVAMAIFSLLCTPCIHCCRRDGCGSSPKSAFFYIVLILAVLGGTFWAYSANADVGSGLIGFADGLNEAAEVFVTAIGHANESYIHLDDALTALDILQTESCPDDSTGVIDPVFSEVDAAFVLIQEAVNGVINGSTVLIDDMLYLEAQIVEADELREDGTYAALAFSTLVFGLGLLDVLCVCAVKKSCGPLYYIILLLGCVVLFGAWAVAGLNGLLGVILSDICVDPVSTMTLVASDDAAQLEIRNLFTCAEESPTFEGLNSAYHETAAVADALESLLDLEPLCTGENFMDNYWQVSNDTFDAIDDIGNMVGTLTCPIISPIWTNVIYDSMCYDLPLGTNLMMLGCSVIGLCGWMALCILPKREGDKVQDGTGPIDTEMQSVSY